MRAIRWSVLLATVLVLMTGCLPSTPSPQDWRTQAAQALDDVASEMATAQVVVRERHRGHLLGRSPQVLLVDAEEAAGTSAQSFSAVQPPPGWESRQRSVSDLLEQGAGLVTDTRVAVVRGDALPESLASDLASTRQELVARAEALR